MERSRAVLFAKYVLLCESGMWNAVGTISREDLLWNENEKTDRITAALFITCIDFCLDRPYRILNTMYCTLYYVMVVI